MSDESVCGTETMDQGCKTKLEYESDRSYSYEKAPCKYHEFRKPFTKRITLPHFILNDNVPSYNFECTFSLINR